MKDRDYHSKGILINMWYLSHLLADKCKWPVCKIDKGCMVGGSVGLSHSLLLGFPLQVFYKSKKGLINLAIHCWTLVMLVGKISQYLVFYFTIYRTIYRKGNIYVANIVKTTLDLHNAQWAIEHVYKSCTLKISFLCNEASKFYHHVLKVRLSKFDNFLFNFLKIDNLLDGFRHHLPQIHNESFRKKSNRERGMGFFVVDTAI